MTIIKDVLFVRIYRNRRERNDNLSGGQCMLVVISQMYEILILRCFVSLYYEKPEVCSRSDTSGMQRWKAHRLQTALHLTSALFWDTAQRIVIIPYRRFGTTYRSLLKSQGKLLNSEYGTDRLSGRVGKELPTLLCIITQLSADPIYITAEAWNRTYYCICNNCANFSL
jgi:hypothetical protein